LDKEDDEEKRQGAFSLPRAFVAAFLCKFPKDDRLAQRLSCRVVRKADGRMNYIRLTVFFSTL
jgi:hypothetical protein